MQTIFTVKLFSACTTNTYGDACTGSCDCVSGNSANINQMCNHVTGVCECRTWWTGSRCEIDVDECTAGTHLCAAQNKFCHNIVGGFTCSCLVNYRDQNGACVPIPGMFRRLPLTHSTQNVTLF